MAKNPDPSIKLTSSKGQTRTLREWTTMFHLTLVILPPRPEAARFIPIADRIFKVFADADTRTGFCVTGNEFIARGVLGEAEDRFLTLCDPDAEFVTSMGLTHLPAFVHIRQDTTLLTAAEGWDPHEWQRVAAEIGKELAWTHPEISKPGDPPATPGWPV